VEKASLEPAADGSAVPVDGTVISRTYHGLHSRYVVRCHGSEIRLLVKEDGGAHPVTGSPATVYVQPAHVLQYHSETGISLDSRLQEANRA
jgi:iron(III) transport system ATP-binding protein